MNNKLESHPLMKKRMSRNLLKIARCFRPGRFSILNLILRLIEAIIRLTTNESNYLSLTFKRSYYEIC